jgi:hypothetical protein
MFHSYLLIPPEKPYDLSLLEIYSLDGCHGSSRDNTHPDILFSVVSPWGFIGTNGSFCQLQRSDPSPEEHLRTSIPSTIDKEREIFLSQK